VPSANSACLFQAPHETPMRFFNYGTRDGAISKQGDEI
jgi:hypothetical protein